MFCEANNTKLNSSKSNVLKMCLKQKILQYVLTSKNTCMFIPAKSTFRSNLHKLQYIIKI